MKLATPLKRYQRMLPTVDGRVKDGRLPSKKTDLDPLLQSLRDKGWDPCLTKKSYRNIIATRLRTKNLPLAFVAVQILIEEQPITLRGLMYRIVSCGWLPSTDEEHYK